MHQGVISRWDGDRGYGFIKADSGGSYFAHIKFFARRLSLDPEKGNRVSFDIVIDERSPDGRERADRIEVI